MNETAENDAGGWQAESLIDLRIDAARIVADMDFCVCPDNPHMNALHDLAHDVARVLGPAPFLCYPCASRDHDEHKLAWVPDIPCECPICVIPSGSTAQPSPASPDTAADRSET